MLLLATLLVTVPCNAHPQYAVQASIAGERVRHEGGGYVASAQIHFSLRETQPAIIPSVDPGLLDHVRGHQTVAERVAHSSGGTVEATGATQAQAQARLKQTVNRMRGDLQNELVREEQAYENVTAYGAQQSQGPAYGFPGGEDVTSPCGH